MERAPLTKEEWLALEKKANDLRHLCLQTTVWAGSGHIGGGMRSYNISVDILIADIGGQLICRTK